MRVSPAHHASLDVFLWSLSTRAIVIVQNTSTNQTSSRTSLAAYIGGTPQVSSHTSSLPRKFLYSEKGGNPETWKVKSESWKPDNFQVLLGGANPESWKPTKLENQNPDGGKPGMSETWKPNKSEN